MASQKVAKDSFPVSPKRQGWPVAELGGLGKLVINLQGGINDSPPESRMGNVLMRWTTYPRKRPFSSTTTFRHSS